MLSDGGIIGREDVNIYDVYHRRTLVIRFLQLDVKKYSEESRLSRPSSFVALDHSRRAVILSVHETDELNDVLADLLPV